MLHDSSLHPNSSRSLVLIVALPSSLPLSSLLKNNEFQVLLHNISVTKFCKTTKRLESAITA